MTKSLLEDLLFGSTVPKPQARPTFSDSLFKIKSAPPAKNELISLRSLGLNIKEEKSINSRPILTLSKNRVKQAMEEQYQTSLARVLPSINTMSYSQAKLIKDSWVLNIDMRGSTTIAEKHPTLYPKIIQCFINEMTEVARAYEGELGNFLGDGLTVIFQGSETRRTSNRAVEAAIAMKTATAIISEIINPFTGIDLKCGIGIAYGNFWAMRAGAKFTNESTRIWAGIPVNRASKYAEEANDEIILCFETYNKLTPTNSVNKAVWRSRLPSTIENLPSLIYSSKLIYRID